MNRELRTQLAGKIAAVMVQEASREPKWVAYEVIDELEKTMYELAGRKVPFDDYKKIWKYYNLEGGWTIQGLADRFALSIGTVTAIVKDKYF